MKDAKKTDQPGDSVAASAGFMVDLVNTESTKGCVEGPKLQLELSNKRFFDPSTFSYSKMFGMKTY